MNFHNTIYKIKKNFFPSRISSMEMVEHLKSTGIKLGRDVKFYSAGTVSIDLQRPWLIEIGDYCKITQGVIILAHDYSRSVLYHAYKEVIGEAKKTTIGNNVFIGMNSIILMGATIGDNVIIGAGSIVSGKIPSNSVVAGNPARVIRTLDEHYKRRKEKYIEEAKVAAQTYYKKYGRKPTITEMGAFFPLYVSKGQANILEKNNIQISFDGNNRTDALNQVLKDSAPFESYEEFLNNIDFICID